MYLSMQFIVMAPNVRQPAIDMRSTTSCGLRFSTMMIPRTLSDLVFSFLRAPCDECGVVGCLSSVRYVRVCSVRERSVDKPREQKVYTLQRSIFDSEFTDAALCPSCVDRPSVEVHRELFWRHDAFSYCTTYVDLAGQGAPVWNTRKFSLAKARGLARRLQQRHWNLARARRLVTTAGNFIFRDD